MNGICRYLEEEMKHLSVKLRAGIVLGINDNFEKHILKIYTPKT